MEASGTASLSRRLLVVLAAAAAICLLVGCVAAQQASGVVATNRQYSPAQVGWDLGAAGASCAMWNADMPLDWRKRYGWTAFCGPAGAHGKASCGRCLQVTNAATGANTTARVVDECHNGGLDLDAAVFSEIDTDGAGAAASFRLAVDYVFVDCQD